MSKHKNKKTPEEIEEEWARNWVRSIAEVLAKGPPTESEDEYEKEVKQIMKIALEKGSYVRDLAKKWRRRLIEVLQPNTPVKRSVKNK